MFHLIGALLFVFVVFPLLCECLTALLESNRPPKHGPRLGFFGWLAALVLVPAIVYAIGSFGEFVLFAIRSIAAWLR